MAIKKGGSAPKVKHNDDVVELGDDMEGEESWRGGLYTQLQCIGHEEGALRRRLQTCMHGWWVTRSWEVEVCNYSGECAICFARSLCKYNQGTFVARKDVLFCAVINYVLCVYDERQWMVCGCHGVGRVAVGDGEGGGPRE